MLGLRTLVHRVRLDVLSSASDWAFVMAEADALQSENPTGCIETALQRARTREGRRYELVAAELMLRKASARRSVAPVRGEAGRVH